MTSPIEKAKQVIKGREDKAKTLTSTVDPSTLSTRDLHLKLALHLLLFSRTLGTLHIYRLGTLFTQRGLCSRARTALRYSLKEVQQLEELKSSLTSLLELTSLTLERHG